MTAPTATSLKLRAPWGRLQGFGERELEASRTADCAPFQGSR